MVSAAANRFRPAALRTPHQAARKAVVLFGLHGGCTLASSAARFHTPRPGLGDLLVGATSIATHAAAIADKAREVFDRAAESPFSATSRRTLCAEGHRF